MEAVRSVVLVWALTCAAAPGAVDFLAELERVVKDHDVPAAGGVVFTADRVLAKGVSGVRRRGGDEEVAMGDRWHLGSCTKAMTGTLAAISVERGELEWGATLGEVLGQKVRKMDDGYRGVTLERLMANRGGFPGEVPDELWGELFGSEERGDRQRMALMIGILEDAPAVEGGVYEYSNAGISAAGVMVELAAKGRWEDLMEERLFEPLGMTSAGFGAPGKSSRRADQPWGHGRDGKPVAPGPRADNPAAIGPAGTVHCSVEDYARFAMAHLARNKRLLKNAGWEALHSVKDGEDYAHGWIFGRADGEVMLAHSGSNTMWRARILLVPAKGWGVVAVSNDGGDGGKAACKALIDLGMEMHRGTR